VFFIPVICTLPYEYLHLSCLFLSFLLIILFTSVLFLRV
jgi:hypothetical protein